MEGRGWKIRIWENLGWHYSVETKRVSVSPSVVKGEYFCLLKPHYSLFGSDNNRYRNPNAAVEACLAIARDNLGRYIQIVDEAFTVYAK